MGYVSTSVSGDVLVLTVDRPPVNAMKVELLADVVSGIERVAADPSRSGAVVLAGRQGVFGRRGPASGARVRTG